MKTIMHDWNEYNSKEKCAVIIQIIASIFVVVFAFLNILYVTNNYILTGIGLCVVMLTQYYRLRHTQKSIAQISLVLAVLIALLVILILLVKLNIISC